MNIDPASTAREALAAGDWAGARKLYETALQQQETVEALEGLSESLWWLNEASEAIPVRERAYALARASGDFAAAIRAAVWLSRVHATAFGNAAASNGWVARAESLAEQAGPTVERASVELIRAKKTAIPKLQRVTPAVRSRSHASSATSTSRYSRAASSGARW